MARTQVAISTDLAGDLYNICVWDVTTGNILTTYKSATNGTVPEHCLGVIGDQYLLCSYRNSPILNVWSLDKKDRLNCKMVLPSPVNSLAVSDDGCYCIAGLGSKIYIWQISTGYLLNILEKHYQPVSCIRIATDLSYFVTGGEDGLILIWNFANVAATHSVSTFTVVNGQSNRHDPLWSINNSTKKITDIWMGDCGARTHFAVSSEDHICKIYELCSGELLSTVVFEESANSIHSLVMDRKECFLFAGANDGTIFETRIGDLETSIALPNDKDGDNSDNNQFVDLSHLTSNEESAKKSAAAQVTRSIPKYVGHTGAVKCLAVSIDGHALVSGSADCTIKLWHIESRQCMRTVTFKGPISNLLLWPALSGLFLHDSLESQSFTLDSSNMGSVSSDISLASNSNSQNRNNRSSSFEARYSRTHSLETILRGLQNPPLPVAPFRHDIYQPGKSSTHHQQQSRMSNGNQEDGDRQSSLDPFQTGSISIRNDSRSGTEFWPWNDFAVPTSDDIEQIFNVSQYSSLNQLLPRSELLRKKQLKNGRTTNNKINQNGDNGLVEPEELSDELEPEQDLELEVKRLTQINQQLYRYSVDKIFDSLANQS